MAGTNEIDIWTRFVVAGYFQDATDYIEGRKCRKCTSPKVCNNYYCMLCKVGGLCPTAFQQKSPHCLHPWIQVRRHNMRNVVAANDLERFINIDSVNLIYKCTKNGVDLCYLERPKLCWIDSKKPYYTINYELASPKSWTDPTEPYDTINYDIDSSESWTDSREPDDSSNYDIASPESCTDSRKAYKTINYDLTSPATESLASITDVYPSPPRALPAELSESVWDVYASSSKRRPAKSLETGSEQPVIEGRIRKCENCEDCMLIPLSEFLLGGFLVCSVQCLKSLATHYPDMSLLRLKDGCLEHTPWPLTTKEKLKINVAAARATARRNVVSRNQGEVPQAAATPAMSAPMALAAMAETVSLNASVGEPASAKRKRGRPPKASGSEPAPAKRKRGRPAKALVANQNQLRPNANEDDQGGCIPQDTLMWPPTRTKQSVKGAR